MTGILLVRHTEVAVAWRGRCYGVTDVPLSRSGTAAAKTLAMELAAHDPAWVIHSGLARTRILAEGTAAIAGCPIDADPAWRERDFGSWEGQSWTAIYRATGNAMDGMIDAPATFCPGGGETTCELADRVMSAWRRMPGGRGVIVTHGGPIAALHGTLSSVPVDQWPTLIPPTGETIAIEHEVENRPDLLVNGRLRAPAPQTRRSRCSLPLDVEGKTPG